MTSKGNNKVEKLPPEDVAQFCYQASMLARAGIPLSEGVSALLEDGPAAEREQFSVLTDALNSRRPLSEAMRQSGLFPDYACDAARIGESTGRLEEVLLELNVFYTRQSELRASLAQAVTYPAAMGGLLLFVMYILSAYVLPVFEGALSQLGAGFSPASLTAINGAKYISLVLLIVLLLLLLFVLLLRMSKGADAPMELLNRFISESELIRRGDTHRFLQLLALTQDCGLTIDDCRTLCADIIISNDVKARLNAFADAINSGLRFNEALKSSGLVGGTERRMLEAGSLSGNLGEAARTAADAYGLALNSRLNAYMARLEPTLTALLSIIAGVTLVLVMLPLVSVLGSIG